jgi:hypothetical protein
MTVSAIYANTKSDCCSRLGKLKPNKARRSPRPLDFLGSIFARARLWMLHHRNPPRSSQPRKFSLNCLMPFSNNQDGAHDQRSSSV